MARSWDLMPSFLDVLENHHTPELARRDSVLVRIVATADCFLSTKVQAPPLPERGQSFEREAERFTQLGEGLFGETGWPRVEEALEQEYTRVLPIASAGPEGLVGRSSGDSAREPGSDSRPAPQLDQDSGPRLPKTSLQIEPPQAQTRAQAVRPGPATFLSRCKSFMKQMFS